MYFTFICCIINQDNENIFCNLRIPHQYDGIPEDEIYQKNIKKILTEDARTIKKLSKNKIPENISKIKECKPFYYCGNKKFADMILKVKKSKCSIFNIYL